MFYSSNRADCGVHFKLGASLSFLASQASVSVGDFSDRSDTTGLLIVVGCDGNTGWQAVGQGAGEPLAEVSITQSEPKNKNFCSNFVSIFAGDLVPCPQRELHPYRPTVGQMLVPIVDGLNGHDPLAPAYARFVPAFRASKVPNTGSPTKHSSAQRARLSTRGIRAAFLVVATS